MGGDGWLRRLGPWVGIGTSPAALMTGGGVGEGLRGAEAVLALLVGVLLLGALALTQGLLGQRTGRTLAQLTAGPLGETGSRRTASVVMVVMMVGWFGVNVGVAGVALARLLDLPDAAGVVLFAVVMLGITGFGLGALSGGQAGADPIGFVPAVVLVVGYGAAFSLRTPDFTHDLVRPRHVLWCALAGLVVPTFAFALAGAALQAVTGTWDLADVLRDLGSPEIAYLFAAIGFTGSVLTNIWSGGLSLSDAAPQVGHRAALVAVTVVGTVVAALDFSELMLGWLTVMALAAPGLAAICVVHALRGGGATPGWRLAGLSSWTSGFACGIALDMAGSSLALPVATALPAVVYWVSGRAGERKLADANAGG
jgi:cytosine permease